jgi:hypothetical protein
MEDNAMSSTEFQTACNNVETLFKKEWMQRTDEIKALESRIGAWNCTFAVHIHCQSETQEIMEMVWPIRAAVKAGRLSLDAVKAFLGSTLVDKGDKMNRYYKITELPGVLKEVGTVLPKITAVDDFVKLLDLMLMYIGRYNYWLDSDIDWKTLSETHEQSRKKRGW